MKKLIYSLCIVFLSLQASAQVEAGKVKNTIAGKGSTLALPIERIMLDNFQVTLYLLGGATDQAGSGVGTVSVGVRATLNQVDEALAQEITDEAYAYYVAQWKKRGAEVFCPSKAELEASKKYSKAAAKGEGVIRSGVAVRTSDKDTDYLTSWPAGTNIAFSGSTLVPAWGNAVHMPSDFKGNYFYGSFNATVNFVDFKTAKLGSTASVKGNPQLTSFTSMGLSVWEKTKFGVYSGSQELTGTTDYYDDVTQEQKNILTSQFNFWNYMANREKYKSNALEMIKKSMDDMFADYDATVAKEKG